MSEQVTPLVKHRKFFQPPPRETTLPQKPSILKLNDALTGEFDKGERQQLLQSLKLAAEQVTGNRSTENYDFSVAAIAERDGVSYNLAVENRNLTTVKLNLNTPFAQRVEQLPWEVEPIQSLVNSLMATEGVSHDVAVVLAMTERESSPANTEVTTDEKWRDDFATIVARSGGELETWAASKDTGAITFVAGDNDIFVTQRADGMLVITSSLSGIQQGAPQIVDPSGTDRIVINAGSGDDSIRIDSSVTSNMVLAGGAGRDFIYGGSGNDILIGGSDDDLVRGGSGSDIVLGSTGNDNLEGGQGGDIILGGQGDDHAQGDAGNDVLLGGLGNDSLYGNKGQDIILGNEGNDYLDGGKDNDLVNGNEGDDTISGGKGDDSVHGEAGADTLIGASGADLYGSLDSADTLIVDSVAATQSSSYINTGATIRLVESDASAGSQAVRFVAGQREEFIERVEDDLETLRSLESGQQMLNALDQAKADTFVSRKKFLFWNYGGYEGHTVNLEELDATEHLQFVRDPAGNAGLNRENGFAAPHRSTWRTTDPLNNPNSGTAATIKYNPSVNLQLNTGSATPPIVVLFHEFAHSFNMVTGTGLAGKYMGVDANNNSGSVNNTERQAVGLAVDHDNDPSTPEQLVDGHPFALTENGFRSELNLTPRPFY